MKTIDITTTVKAIASKNTMQSEIGIHMQLQKLAAANDVAWSREMPAKDVKTVVEAFHAKFPTLNRA